MSNNSKKAVQCESAPQAIGPYSVGIQLDDLIFISGQLGMTPDGGDIVAGGIEPETRQALMNLKAILESADSNLENVIKTTVFLVDMADFPKMNTIYAEFFREVPPARSTIAVAALPKGAVVEIEAIALR